MALDPLDDAVESLIAAGLDAERVRMVLRVVRSRWNGQVYIRKADPGREDQIRQALADGLPVAHVARAVGASPSTVRRRRSEWLG